MHSYLSSEYLSPKMPKYLAFATITQYRLKSHSKLFEAIWSHLKCMSYVSQSNMFAYSPTHSKFRKIVLNATEWNCMKLYEIERNRTELRNLLWIISFNSIWALCSNRKQQIIPATILYTVSIQLLWSTSYFPWLF